MFNLERFFNQLVATPLQKPSFFTCSMDLSLVGQTSDISLIKFSDDIAIANSFLKEGALCTSVTLPGRDLETVDMTIYGVEEKYPTFTTFGDVTCNFLLPVDDTSGGTLQSFRSSVLAAFQHWMDYIHQITPASQTYEQVKAPQHLNLRFPDTYRLAQGFTITQYAANRAAEPFVQASDVPVNGLYQYNLNTGYDDETKPYLPSISYNFFNVYPVKITSSQLNWTSGSGFLELAVAFAYTHWSVSRVAT